MAELDLEAIANLELTDAEVRALLVRLGSQEFGFDPRPTLADVSEATGKQPIDLLPELAALRDEQFRRRIQPVLDNHESRIHRLEQRRHPMSNAEIKDYSEDAENFRLNPNTGKPTRIDVMFAVLAAIVIVIALYLARSG